MPVPLPEPSAFLGSRGGAGQASWPAAWVAQERQGTTVVSAHGSGVSDRRPQVREEDLGPGARSARWETSREATYVLNQLYRGWHTSTFILSMNCSLLYNLLICESLLTFWYSACVYEAAVFWLHQYCINWCFISFVSSKACHLVVICEIHFCTWNIEKIRENNKLCDLQFHISCVSLW